MEKKEPCAISYNDKDGEPLFLCAPDGTRIELNEDNDVITTPGGYRFQINLFDPMIIMLGKLNDYNGKQLYEQLERKIKEKQTNDST